MDNSTWTYPCELFETLVYQKNSGKFLEVSCWIESITQYVYLKKKKRNMGSITCENLSGVYAKKLFY